MAADSLAGPSLEPFELRDAALQQSEQAFLRDAAPPLWCFEGPGVRAPCSSRGSSPVLCPTGESDDRVACGDNGVRPLPVLRDMGPEPGAASNQTPRGRGAEHRFPLCSLRLWSRGAGLSLPFSLQTRHSVIFKRQKSPFPAAALLKAPCLYATVVGTCAPAFTCWSPNSQLHRTRLYLETQPLEEGLRLNEVTGVALIQPDRCPCEKGRLGHRHAQRDSHVKTPGEAALPTLASRASVLGTVRR